MSRESLNISISDKSAPLPIADLSKVDCLKQVLPILDKYYGNKNANQNSSLQQNEAKATFTPFPIQRQTFSLLLSGKDVCALAGTGEGKTLAYAVPMLVHVLRNREKKYKVKRIEKTEETNEKYENCGLIFFSFSFLLFFIL